LVEKKKTRAGVVGDFNRLELNSVLWSGLGLVSLAGKG